MKKTIPIYTIEQLNSCDVHIMISVDIRRLEIRIRNLIVVNFGHSYDFYKLIFVKHSKYIPRQKITYNTNYQQVK